MLTLLAQWLQTLSPEFGFFRVFQYLTFRAVMAALTALLMGLIFTLLIAYPFLEKRFTGDTAHHNLLQRPRDAPVRTAIGAMAIAFYMVLTLSARERRRSSSSTRTDRPKGSTG